MSELKDKELDSSDVFEHFINEKSLELNTFDTMENDGVITSKSDIKDIKELAKKVKEKKAKNKGHEHEESEYEVKQNIRNIMRNIIKDDDIRDVLHVDEKKLKRTRKVRGSSN